MKAKTKKKLLIIVIIMLAVFIVSAIISYIYVTTNPVDSYETSNVNISENSRMEFIIEKGANTREIAEQLFEKRLIGSKFIFRALSRFNGFDGTYRSGMHYLANGLNYDQIMRILSGNPESVKVTVPEGFNLKQTLNEMVRRGVVRDTASFERVLLPSGYNYSFLKNAPTDENGLEGFLFPDTYWFETNTDAILVIETMLKNFENKWLSEYTVRAKALNLSIRQVLTIASLIEREAKTPKDRRLIASVIYNRLSSRDSTLRRLQIDATVQYAIYQKDGIMKEKISYDDLRIESPYNTYKNEGLPPGPICSPGKDSIEAALHPEKTQYFYYVAAGDGSHIFSATYSEHLSAIRKYSRK